MIKPKIVKMYTLVEREYIKTVSIWTIFFLASKWQIEHEESFAFNYVNIKSIIHYSPKGAIYEKIRKTVNNQ